MYWTTGHCLLKVPTTLQRRKYSFCAVLSRVGYRGCLASLEVGVQKVDIMRKATRLDALEQGCLGELNAALSSHSHLLNNTPKR